MFRMVDAQDTHIGAPPRSACLMNLCCHVKDFDEGYGSACAPIVDATASSLASVLKGKTCAASGLMYFCRFFDRFKYGVQRIFNGQNKTC